MHMRGCCTFEEQAAPPIYAGSDGTLHCQQVVASLFVLPQWIVVEAHVHNTFNRPGTLQGVAFASSNMFQP